MTDLTFHTPDATGQACSQCIFPIGQKLQHTGNGKTYVIQGFCWLGADDLWGYIHSEIRADGLPGVPIVRPMEHIQGNKSDGQRRYEEVL